MAKVIITGSKGVVGTVLIEGLKTIHNVVGLDLPENDISNYEQLLEQFIGADIVFHTAHSKKENWNTGAIDPHNVLLEMNVLTAAVEAKVKRLVVASSVHADNFNEYSGDESLIIPGSHSPTSPYGTHKLITEEIGKFYSSHYGLEFIAIRLGGITKDNTVRTHSKERQVWLSHRDLVNLAKMIISAQEVPNKYSIFYAVSDNEGRIHSTDNPFDWSPIDNSKDFPPYVD